MVSGTALQWGWDHPSGPMDMHQQQTDGHAPTTNTRLHTSTTHASTAPCWGKLQASFAAPSAFSSFFSCSLTRPYLSPGSCAVRWRPADMATITARFVFETVTDVAFVPSLGIVANRGRHFELFIGLFQVGRGKHPNIDFSGLPHVCLSALPRCCWDNSTAWNETLEPSCRRQLALWCAGIVLTGLAVCHLYVLQHGGCSWRAALPHHG